MNGHLVEKIVVEEAVITLSAEELNVVFSAVRYYFDRLGEYTYLDAEFYKLRQDMNEAKT